MANRFWIILTVMAVGVICVAAAQPISGERALLPQKSLCIDISGWNPERRESIIPSFKSPHITDECFFSMVSSLVALDKKILEDSIAPVFSVRMPKNSFTLDLLFSLYKIKPLADDGELWGKVIDIWSASSPKSPYEVLADNSEGGKIPIADTLYRALDAAGRLDVHELLRYGRIKCLIGDYRAAASIYCRVAADRRLEHAAVTQMEQLFADADSAVKSASLRDFLGCVLSRPAIDTAFYRNRFADFYGRCGLFDEEILILTALNTQSAPSGRKLAEAAKMHFTRRRYRLAAAASVAAYDRLEDGNEARSAAAFIAYQAYTQLKLRDSALVWLRLSGATSKDAKIQAVALNQETGHSDEAARLLDALPTSLSKDTLTVRQYIFAGEMNKALNHITAATPSWIMSPRERILWRVRCLIFDGRPYEAVPELDSLRFMASWHGTSEALRYKYWLQKLDGGDVPMGASEAWGRLEYRIYTGDLNAAIKGLRDFHNLTGGVGEALSIRLAGALASYFRYSEALEALELVGGKAVMGGGPEHLYITAETLKVLGRHDDARNIAQKILAEYPADIFAQKARILLANI